MKGRGRQTRGHASMSQALRAMPLLSTLATLISTLFLSACAIGNQHFGRSIDVADVARIEIGESTKQDILDLFGPPTYYSRPAGMEPSGTASRSDGQIELARDGEDIFTYEYREDGERFFTVLLFTRFSRTAIADTLMVFFDSEDLVRYVAFAKQSKGGGSPKAAR